MPSDGPVARILQCFSPQNGRGQIVWLQSARDALVLPAQLGVRPFSSKLPAWKGGSS